MTISKKTWLIIALTVSALLLVGVVVLAIVFLPQATGGEPTTTTTAPSTTTSTTVATTTTTRIWNQNGRNICKTCNYVYKETIEDCPACAGQGVFADMQCPTCLGAHDVDEGQAWEYCSFCQDYFVVTEGAVHTCKQCKTEGLTAEMLDPTKGELCQKCIDGTHVCAKCGSNCHGQYHLKGAIACESCYAKVMYRACDWCHIPKASVRPISEHWPEYAKICDDCFVTRREATAAEYDAYIAWFEATYGPLDPMLGLNGRLEVCPYCSGKSVHNGIVFECKDCGRNSVPPGTTR